MIDICPLTGKKIKLTQPNPSVAEFFYETQLTGKVTISDVAFMSAGSLSEEEKLILIGICRNKTLRKESFSISSSLFSQLKNQPIPYSFEEKSNYFLQYLYDHGGKEYQSHDIYSDIDAPITYSSQDEFERIIEYLLENGWVRSKGIFPSKQSIFYNGLRISKEGIEKIEGTSTEIEINNYNETELNNSVDSIELKVRNLVTSTLTLETGKNNFEDLLTGEPKQQLRRRIRLHLENHPNLRPDDFKNLSKSIQFCDIEHLKAIILKDEYWNFFAPQFKNRSLVDEILQSIQSIKALSKTLSPIN